MDECFAIIGRDAEQTADSKGELQMKSSMEFISSFDGLKLRLRRDLVEEPRGGRSNRSWKRRANRDGAVQSIRSRTTV